VVARSPRRRNRRTTRGSTGRVTVGHIYMLKLHYLVYPSRRPAARRLALGYRAENFLKVFLVVFAVF